MKRHKFTKLVITKHAKEKAIERLKCKPEDLEELIKPLINHRYMLGAGSWGSVLYGDPLKSIYCFVQFEDGTAVVTTILPHLPISYQFKGNRKC